MITRAIRYWYRKEYLLEDKEYKSRQVWSTKRRAEMYVWHEAIGMMLKVDSQKGANLRIRISGD